MRVLTIAALLLSASATAFGINVAAPPAVASVGSMEVFGSVQSYVEADNMVRYSEPFVPLAASDAAAASGLAQPVASPYLTGRFTLVPNSRTGAVRFDFSGSEVAGEMIPPSNSVTYTLGVAINYPCITAENLMRGNILSVFIDDAEVTQIDTGSYWNQRRCGQDVVFPIAANILGNRTVRVVKLTEPNTGDADNLRNLVTFLSVTAKSLAILSFKPLAPKPLALEFVGDSITCGYHVNCKSNKEPAVVPYTYTSVLDGYSGQACALLGAACNYVSWSGRGMAINLREEGALVSELYKYSHGTDLSAEARWDFGLVRPQVVIINLGTNDFNSPAMRNTSTAAATEELYIATYARFLGEVANAYSYGQSPKVAILAVCGNMHYRYCAAVEAAIGRAVAANPNMRTPYFMQIAKKLTPDTSCSNHPDKVNSAIVAEQLAAYIKDTILPAL